MAHIGKFYKLAFRRDLANTGNNRSAYPEGAFLSVSALQGAVGARISDNDIIVANLMVDGQPPMIWTSDTIIAGGVPFYCKVTAYDFSVGVDPLGRLQVYDSMSGVILFDSGTDVDRMIGFPSNCGWFARPPFAQTPLCRPTGVLFSFGMSAATWADYP